MRKRTDPWFKLYSKDWIGDVELRLCSPAARGLLADLMCLCDQGDPYGYLKRSNGEDYAEKELYSLLHYKPAEFRRLWAELMDHSRMHEDEIGVFNFRLREERRKTEAYRKQGKKGGNPSLTGKAPGARPPAKGPGKKKTAKRYDYSIEYESFWKLCPKQRGKRKASLAFDVCIAAGVPLQKIMDGIKKYADECEAAKTEERWIAHPTTWLNDGGWDDVHDRDAKKKRSKDRRLEVDRKKWLADMVEFVGIVTMYCDDRIPDLDDRIDRIEADVERRCGKPGVKYLRQKTAAARKAAKEDAA